MEWMELKTNGVPGEFLLAFAVLIWVIFALILLSAPRKPLHVWCFFSGLLFGTGALKEFLFYTLGPDLIRSGIWTAAFSKVLYSVLSAVFYHLTMPTMLVFCLYFHRLDRTRPVLLRWLRLLAYVPPILMSAAFPWTKTLALQQDTTFCIAVGVYNWCYGLAGTAVMVHALREERLSASYEQRRLAAVMLLTPLWFWLISAFPYHALGIPNLSKLWQINLLVMLCVLLYFLYHTFREGIWGLRIRLETYDWNSGTQMLQKNAHYVSHALKNDLAKIAWCADALASRGDFPREAEILRHSAQHLQRFISRTQLYAQEITVRPELCDMGALLRDLAEEFRQGPGHQVFLKIAGCDEAPLLCDRPHVEELLRNLISNAADAAGNGGEVTLSYHRLPRKRCAVITVADNGPGMDQDTVRQIFAPYYTTKSGCQNLGLGLYYCRNVMRAHGGKIRVSSAPGAGSVFTLLFPIKRREKETEAHV